MRGSCSESRIGSSRPDSMLRCEECGCLSESGKGWLGYIVEDHEEEGEETIVCTYCPPCAERELDARPRSSRYL
jgi:hypothetical protein